MALGAAVGWKLSVGVVDGMSVGARVGIVDIDGCSEGNVDGN